MGKRIFAVTGSISHYSIISCHSASWGVHRASHCPSSPDPALPYSPPAATVHTNQQPPSNHSSASSPNRGVFEEPAFTISVQADALSERGRPTLVLRLHHSPSSFSAASAAGHTEMTKGFTSDGNPFNLGFSTESVNVKLNGPPLVPVSRLGLNVSTLPTGTKEAS